MTDTKKVVVVQPMSAVAMELFAARADVEVQVLPDFRPETIAAAMADADAITIRDAPLPAEMIALAPRLTIVSRHGVGYDNVPVDACTGRPAARATRRQFITGKRISCEEDRGRS